MAACKYIKNCFHEAGQGPRTRLETDGGQQVVMLGQRLRLRE